MFFSEHTVDREDWSTQLLHSSPFYPTTQNPMLYNALLIGKVPLLVQASTSLVRHVPWTHLSQHPKLHLDRFSYFCTALRRDSLYFTMCVKTWL